MGYTTRFSGRLELGRAATPREQRLLRAISDRSSAHKAERVAAAPKSRCGWIFVEPHGEVLGSEGCEVHDCETWSIAWDQSEKFYLYLDWLRYICDNVLERDTQLAGTIRWQGDEDGDVGKIVAAQWEPNAFEIVRGKKQIVYEDGEVEEL